MIIRQKQILGLIFAGGENRRMGMGTSPKWQLSLEDNTLLEHIIQRVQPQVSQLCINGSHPELNKYGYPVIDDDQAYSSQGPLAGLLAGLHYAKTHGFEWLATCPCDSPFVPCDYINQLRQAITHARLMNNTPILAGIIEHHQKLQPVFGLWSVDLLDKLQHTLTHTSTRAIGFWAQQQQALVINFVANNADLGDSFMNINTPEEWLLAQRTYKQHKSDHSR